MIFIRFLIFFSLLSALFGDTTPLMMLRVGAKRTSLEETQDATKTFQHQEQEWRKTEDNNYSSIMPRGNINQRISEKDISKKEQTPSPLLSLDEVAAIIDCSPLSSGKMVNLEQQHQALLATAQLKNDAAEKAEAKLMNWHPSLQMEKKELSLFQEPLEVAVRTAKEALFAWSSLASFKEDYAALPFSDHDFISENFSLRTIENSMRSWEARLSYYELLQTEHDAALLLQTIDQITKNQTLETFYSRAKLLFTQREDKIIEIRQNIASLAALYQEGYDQAPPNAQGWWVSRLEKCSSHDVFWEAHLLKNQTLQKKLKNDMAQKTAFLFLNDKRIDLTNQNDAIASINFLKKATQKTQQEKEAWSNLAEAYNRIKQNHPDDFSIYLEKELSIAQEKQTILYAQEQAHEAIQKEIDVRSSYNKVLKTLQTYHRKDPLQKTHFETAQQKGLATQENWNKLIQFCLTSAPQSIQLKKEWDSLISYIEEERAISAWNNSNFKKEIGILSVEQQLKYYLVSDDALIFYNDLIQYGKDIVSHSKMLSNICQNRLKSLTDALQETDENSVLKTYWRKKYQEAEELKSSWLSDIAKWNIKKEALLKTTK